MVIAVGADKRRHEALGCSALPPCSPDFSPIENGFPELKTLLRMAAARTMDAPCANHFTAAGSGPGWAESAPVSNL